MYAYNYSVPYMDVLEYEKPTHTNTCGKRTSAESCTDWWRWMWILCTTYTAVDHWC